MAEQKKIPSFILRIAYDIIAEETPDRAALNRVLELAGLQRYAENPPPMDDSPAITRREYERMLGVVREVFDEVQARAIFRRTGQRGFDHLTRSGVLSFANFLRAFDSLTSKTERVALAMQRLTGELSRALGNRHDFHRDGEDFILDIYDCPYCSQLPSDLTPGTELRLCYVPVAFYQAAVNWASGTKNTVREISCHAATGQGFCRFKIFWGIGVNEPLE